MDELEELEDLEEMEETQDADSEIMKSLYTEEQLKKKEELSKATQEAELFESEVRKKLVNERNQENANFAILKANLEKKHREKIRSINVRIRSTKSRPKKPTTSYNIVNSMRLYFDPIDQSISKLEKGIINEKQKFILKTRGVFRQKLHENLGIQKMSDGLWTTCHTMARGLLSNVDIVMFDRLSAYRCSDLCETGWHMGFWPDPKSDQRAEIAGTLSKVELCDVLAKIIGASPIISELADDEKAKEAKAKAREKEKEIKEKGDEKSQIIKKGDD